MKTHFDEFLAMIGLNGPFEANANIEFKLNKPDGSAIEVLFKVETAERSVKMLAMTEGALSQAPNEAVLMHFAQQALQPLLGGAGISICPDNKKVVIFNLIDVNKLTAAQIKSTFEDLIMRVEQWESRLKQLDTTATPSRSMTATPKRPKIFGHKF